MQLSAVISQKPYEKIIFVLHRHPFTFIPILAFFILLLLLPVGVYFLILNLFPNWLDSSTITYAIGVLLGSIYYLGIYLFFYVQFLDYYLDIWIVTNDRIVDIEQNGLFSRVITELDLFRVQDITTNIHGFFPTLFHYGDLIIKTASTNTHIVFRKVPNPNDLREKIIQLADHDRRYHMTN